ncbi:MAG: hypothetical protein K9K66_09045 [Desulfarculaceae bacterium]|nr:hypothetical protein [Desulfarculaceae bacterium]MCF8073123.1 hypothetical protein [Desulfarculaceae bacterium]MCF8101792.1 hypothetical protein [Desulfarculaceae bacterium]MCF8117356.1 hypothetical protein [Desulfarculaceae bacterium]
MAEIKSALEIALERAAALGAGEDDSRREAREKGRALARRLLEGEAEPDDLAGLQAGAARLGAAGALLEALGGRQPAALEGLKALAVGTPAVAVCEEVAAALEERAAAQDALHQQLAQEMAADLAALGAGGPAMRPNPAAHPEYAARAEDALAGAEKGLQAAGERYQEALGQG